MALLERLSIARALIRVAQALEDQNRLIMAANKLTNEALQAPAAPDWSLEPSVTTMDDEDEWKREQEALRAAELGENAGP